MYKRQIKFLSLIGFGLLLAALFYCLQYGSDIKGAKRWIDVFGQSLQPSEFIKPFFIIINAWLLTIWKSTQKNKFLFLSILSILSIDIMLLLQPDLGMTLLITTIWIFQLLITGIPMLFFIFLIFLIPTKGMTLPLLSYGGSSTISAAIVIGFLLSLTRKRIDFSEVSLNIENYK